MYSFYEGFLVGLVLSALIWAGYCFWLFARNSVSRQRFVDRVRRIDRKR